MSIQQSINQAISGSLYLLGQSTLFKTLKEEREEKISRERNKIDSVLNSAAIPKIAAGNEPLPQTPVEQNEQNETSNALKAAGAVSGKDMTQGPQ